MRQEPRNRQVDEDTIVRWLTDGGDEDERDDDTEQQSVERSQEGNRHGGVKEAGKLAGRE